MKRAATAVALVIGSVFGVIALADATQNRPDRVHADSASRLTFSVEHRDGPAAIGDAQALWSVCSRTARRLRPTAPLAALGGGAFHIEVTPAVGHNARKRLVGCLEDITLDGLLGRVTALETLPSQ